MAVYFSAISSYKDDVFVCTSCLPFLEKEILQFKLCNQTNFLPETNASQHFATGFRWRITNFHWDLVKTK